MNRYSIAEFVSSTAQKDRGEGLFELESERMLEINVNGHVWIKMGSMVAYTGDIRFTRERVLEHGLGRFLKKSFTGEGVRLTKAEGRGPLYLADKGKKVSILNLQGESLFVNGNDLLAFEEQIQWDIKLMRKITTMLAGGPRENTFPFWAVEALGLDVRSPREHSMARSSGRGRGGR